MLAPSACDLSDGHLGRTEAWPGHRGPGARHPKTSTTAPGNLPDALEQKLHRWVHSGLLPDFPFGTELTDDELHLVRALKRMKHATHHPAELVTIAIRSLWEGKEAPHAYLERLGLAEARSFKDMFVRRLFASNL